MMCPVGRLLLKRGCGGNSIILEDNILVLLSSEQVGGACLLVLTVANRLASFRRPSGLHLSIGRRSISLLLVCDLFRVSRSHSHEPSKGLAFFSL